MCWMIAIAAAGLALSAAGTAMSAQSQAAAQNYQAKVAQNNAVIASDNARAALSAGTVKAQQQLSISDQRQGAIRATLAANGGTLDSGSALDLQADAGRTGALNAYTTQYNAGLQAQGFRAQGSNFEAQSQLDNAAASNAGTAGAIGAGASLLSGASNFAGKWAAYQQQGGGT